LIIRLIADQYPEYVNGAANFTVRLATGLAGLGHTVTVIWPSRDATQTERLPLLSWHLPTLTRQLINLLTDPAERHHMGQVSQTMVANHSLNATLDAFERCYEKIRLHPRAVSAEALRHGSRNS